MDISTVGAAIISISGALFTAACLWSLIGLLLKSPTHPRKERASTAHRLTSALIVLTGLVTHVLGYFSESFVLLYAGGASMVVAAACAHVTSHRFPNRVQGPGILAACGITVLTIGLIL